MTCYIDMIDAHRCGRINFEKEMKRGLNLLPDSRCQHNFFRLDPENDLVTEAVRQVILTLLGGLRFVVRGPLTFFRLHLHITNCRPVSEISRRHDSFSCLQQYIYICIYYFDIPYQSMISATTIQGLTGLNTKKPSDILMKFQTLVLSYQSEAEVPEDRGSDCATIHIRMFLLFGSTLKWMIFPHYM